jgi:hypothetical protein
VGSLGLLAKDAHAHNYTGWFKIASLEDDITGGFVVTPVSLQNIPANNPAGCTQNTGTSGQMEKFAFMSSYSQSNLEYREMLRQQLMAAFLAGREIALYTSSSSCPTGSGSYYWHVKVH